jgi:hypothetical protein
MSKLESCLCKRLFLVPRGEVRGGVAVYLLLIHFILLLELFEHLNPVVNLLLHDDVLVQHLRVPFADALVTEAGMLELLDAALVVALQLLAEDV